MKIIIKTVILLLLASCANMVPPTGGKKDIDPPKLIAKRAIEDMKNVNAKTIEFEFNEYIQTNKWNEFFYISPPIENKIQKKIKAKNLSITIEDSLANNTTYYLSLNSCIKDINEGNILDTLSYIFSTSDSFNNLRVSGELKDANTLKVIENAWVMLFDKQTHDSLIFKTRPSYIAKTNKDGFFHFQNLNNDVFSIVALTGFDFIYNESEKIGFFDTTINTGMDSFVSLVVFDPILKNNSTSSDTLIRFSDSIKSDTIEMKKNLTGSIILNMKQYPSIIFQLIQNEKISHSFSFNSTPFILNKITAGSYMLKCILDKNGDGKWTPGNWEEKIQPEKVFIYPQEITIRSNWDLELDWDLK
mgnify:CR=1 FL=1